MTHAGKPTAASPSARRGGAWWLLAAGLFIIQLGIIWALSGPGPVRRIAPPEVSSALVTGLMDTERAPLNDPVLFALATPQGFSGPAWLTPPRLATGLAEWSEAESWMNTGATNWGGAFLAAAPRLAVPPRLEADKPGPGLLEVPVPPRTPAVSTLHVAGALAGRKLLTPLRPLSWAHDDVLADTVVRLTVDGDGAVQSAAVISQAGVRDAAQTRADNHALALARAARFEPLPNAAAGESSTTFGEFIFQWSVTPPALEKESPPRQRQ